MIQQFLAERAGPMMGDFVRSDEHMTTVFEASYKFLPLPLRWLVSQKDFVAWSLSRRDQIVDANPSAAPPDVQKKNGPEPDSQDVSAVALNSFKHLVARVTAFKLSTINGHDDFDVQRWKDQLNADTKKLASSKQNLALASPNDKANLSILKEKVAVAETQVTAAEGVLKDIANGDRWTRHYFWITDVAYDVHTTNSLVSLFTATLVFSFNDQWSELQAETAADSLPLDKCHRPNHPIRCKLDLAYQDGTWVVKQFLVKKSPTVGAPSPEWQLHSPEAIQIQKVLATILGGH